MAQDGRPTAPPPVPPASDRLLDRTFVGLLVAQFFAAFNDQAIHAAAMFYAINTQTLTEAEAISLMPILFYSPWAIFCTLAGHLADRFSKRHTLVFWKVAEVAIVGVALVGFSMGHESTVGPWLVLSTVFLMGTHSAFFVPAKYGVMPEILKPHLLSRGNGLLESLSFLAVILGTVSGGVLSFLFLRREAMIGLVLLVLALVGAAASLLIRKMPAANPHMRLAFRDLYAKLFVNLRTLVASRPLALAVIGIAFFTFVVAYMRATVYMLGESQNPRWTELKTSVVVGAVALGIGLGSPLAGLLSGRKVELGLVPLGAVGMILGAIGAACTLHALPWLVAFIVLIGFFTGFYIVPLFTLLQHRAPKRSKGEMIATSNFINVTGAIVASAFFFFLVHAAKLLDLAPRVAKKEVVAAGELVDVEWAQGRPVFAVVRGEGQVEGATAVGERPDAGRPPDVVGQLRRILEAERERAAARAEIELDRGLNVRSGEDRPGSQVELDRFLVGDVVHYHVRAAGKPSNDHYDLHRLPRSLFLGAGLLTLLTLFTIVWRQPDLIARTAWFLGGALRRRANVAGIENVPGTGGVVLLTSRGDPEAVRLVRSATDRHALVLDGDVGVLDAGLARVVREERVVVVAATSHQGNGLGDLVRRAHAAGAQIVPVACEPDAGGAVCSVEFRPPLPPGDAFPGVDAVFSRMRRPLN